MFRVRLDNEDLILGYVSGKIRRSFIRILPGDKVKIEECTYCSRKSARRIPKGVIHVQASFNNTIVTVTDVRGRVVSWSSAGTCGFKGTRRGTPFAAQTAAANAIRTVVDQGMQRAEVMIKGPGLGRDSITNYS
ncbi:30S ribosomal protein S11, chloroplastic [Sesamum angolense]|uniref:30S ribosomal protein S11, chloroplastic n=1 Tax=Sesamum angolense TaxID=2727404 RepID=A0AAE1X0T4_9LAMI|nr:30S ribosomal protein S11, chloroplastic [Sesamum angolense]